MERAVFKMPVPAPKRKENRIHSEKHELIAQMRRDFGETATRGKGSFGFYLWLLRDVSCGTIRIWLGSIDDSPNLRTQESRRRIFWWTYKRHCGSRPANES